MFTILAVAAYIGGGILTYGLAFANLTAEWPSKPVRMERSDRRIALLLAMLGPIGWVVVLIVCGVADGLRYR